MKHPIPLLRRHCAGFLALVLLAAPPVRADIVAADGWSRATPPRATTAVGYLVLTNTGGESRSLLRIVSPVSDRVMIHRSSIDNNGVARMWPMGEFTLRAGETLRFDPNGFHVMFMDIKAPFVAGTKVPLSLLFEDEKEVTVMLEVRPLVPEAAVAKHPR
ncbi:MAG: copper chaperone PCu(A)C [Steroidobacteraceae bacterium]